MKHKVTLTIECTEREDLDGAIYAAGGTMMDMARLAALKKRLDGQFDWTDAVSSNRYAKDDIDAPQLVRDHLKGVIETSFQYEEIGDET